MDGPARNIKIVYLASNLSLSTAQLEALVRHVGKPDAVMHELPPTDGGEQLHVVELTWPDDRRSTHELRTRLWLYQVPTDPMSTYTRMQILAGADLLVMCAERRSPIPQSSRWIDELKHHHASPLHAEAPPRVVIQYVCPPDSRSDAATLRSALDSDGEFAELVFDHDDPEQLATRTMESIVASIVAMV